jgi:hypothetical protein
LLVKTYPGIDIVGLIVEVIRILRHIRCIASWWILRILIIFYHFRLKSKHWWLKSLRSTIKLLTLKAVVVLRRICLIFRISLTIANVHMSSIFQKCNLLLLLPI